MLRVVMVVVTMVPTEVNQEPITDMVVAVDPVAVRVVVAVALLLQLKPHIRL